MTARALRLVLFACSGTLAACQCITVPAVDTAAPSGTVTVIFQDPDASGYQERSVSVTSVAGAQDETVRLPASWPFQLLWHGSDEGGVQRLDLEEQFIEPPPETGPGSVSQPLWPHPSMPSGDFSGCAQAYRALDVDWTPWGGTHTFRLTVRDFHGNTATTKRLTIQQE